ncbi:MAG: BTAD domain-containing putative transcriptional regulator [Dehalococcoidia bacterium]
MESALLRIYLSGPVCLESGGQLANESRFGSRQGRLLFAYLVAERDQPTPRENLAELLWPGQMPTAWDSAMVSLVSKLRQFLGTLPGADPGPEISSQYGCYQLKLPARTWIDLEAAQNALDEAEGNLRSGDFAAAWGATNVALAITKRPFLPGETGDWVELKRQQLVSLQVRALDSYVSVCLNTDQPSLAVQMANQAVALEPYRETGYQRLMLAHRALGNRAEALRVYQRCRELLSEELGVDPSPETEAIYLDLLA